MEEEIISEVESNMKLSITHLIDNLSKIRTGRANPSLVANINVEYYGTQTPLQQLATINIPDPKLIVIQPFDKSSINEIEKSIQNEDIGLNPSVDGDIIRIPIPALSEERRKELTKVASKESEEAKISIRSHRRNGIDNVSKQLSDSSTDDTKRIEDNIQKLTDLYIQKIDEILSQKQNELLEV
mgnify:CR=1 FL=1|tara:strand:+ start:21 stop:572 length:552 start_codon:yes stop_codon:yes gene_type:complete